jgi:DNA topoisomerase-1
MKYLVIVESPSKCKKIQKYLKECFPNDEFIVKASVGHIMKLALSGVGNMGIDFDNNYEPNFIIDPKKKKVVKELKSLKKNVDKVIIATDLDLEGAKIGYDIAKYLKLDFNEKNRIIFNEITKKALKTAFLNPQKIDINMVHSQFARRVLDRIIGFDISKITAKEIQKGSSAGRVISTTTKLIYEKEEEIKNGKEDSYYEILGDFQNEKYILKDCIYNKKKKYKKLKVIKSLFQKYKKSDFSIESIIEKNEESQPSKPYITSTINQSSPYSIKKTSMVLQKLYQQGFITYIRTDSYKMSKEAKNMMKKYIVEKYGENYFKLRTFDKKNKSSQEAHECIRVTNINKLSSELDDPQEKKIYNLIWKRSLECLMENSKFKSKDIKINVSETKKKFQKKINYFYFLGFKILSNTLNELNKDCLFFDQIKTDDQLNYIIINSKKKYISSGSRYNESKLVKELEKLGIGRPSTYGNTIESILKKGYIVKKDIKPIEVESENLKLENDKIYRYTIKEKIKGEKQKLLITELGITVTKFLETNFQVIMNYNFTSEIENDLKNILNKDKIWYNVVDDYYNKFKPDVKKFENTSSKNNDFYIGEFRNKNFYRFKSKWGPRVMYGELGNKDTLFLTLPEGKVLKKITLEECIMLLPTDIGKYKGKGVELRKGKSFYIRYEKQNYPLHWDFKNLKKEEITLENCIFSIENFKIKLKKKK